MLKQLGIDSKTIKNIVIALYEAEVNVVAHAWKGTVSVEIDENKITILVSDEGPGIPDIDLAMQAGYSTASKKVREMGFGAGMGLPNIKKNTDELLTIFNERIVNISRLRCLKMHWLCTLHEIVPNRSHSGSKRSGGNRPRTLRLLRTMPPCLPNPRFLCRTGRSGHDSLIQIPCYFVSIYHDWSVS